MDGATGAPILSMHARCFRVCLAKDAHVPAPRGCGVFAGARFEINHAHHVVDFLSCCRDPVVRGECVNIGGQRLGLTAVFALFGFAFRNRSEAWLRGITCHAVKAGASGSLLETIMPHATCSQGLDHLLIQDRSRCYNLSSCLQRRVHCSRRLPLIHGLDILHRSASLTTQVARASEYQCTLSCFFSSVHGLRGSVVILSCHRRHLSRLASMMFDMFSCSRRMYDCKHDACIFNCSSQD